MNPVFYKLGAVWECDSEKDIKKAVRKLYKMGVSAVKTAVVSQTFTGMPQVCWTDRQLQTLTDEAHGFGLKVCAHITYTEDYAQAVRCGIDSIHHAAFTQMNLGDLDAMIEKGVVFVPTVSLFDLMVTGLREKWILNSNWDPPVNEKIKQNMRAFTEAFHSCSDDEPVGNLFVKVPKSVLSQIAPSQLNNIREYIRRGGKVAMGTDASLGFSLHTTPVREIQMLEEAGLSKLEAIKASTLTSASVFGKDHEIGSVEVGKYADILVVKGDIIKDLKAVGNTDMVIINGEIVYRNSGKQRSNIFEN
jgi:imidazolonepropionase-like amidohydrolase